MEPLKDVAPPPVMTDKINELVEAYNAIMEAMPGGLRRRMEHQRLPLKTEPPIPPEPEE